MPKKKGKIRWGAALMAVAGVVGALADPHMLALLPARVSSVIVVAAVIGGALLKPAVRKEHERRP